MKFSELNPRLEAEDTQVILSMDCPVHHERHIMACVDGDPGQGRFKWTIQGIDSIRSFMTADRGTMEPNWDRMTISPSINAHDCGHFTINDGNIQMSS